MNINKVMFHVVVVVVVVVVLVVENLVIAVRRLKRLRTQHFDGMMGCHSSSTLISFGGRSAHLAYHVHKSGCKI